MDQHFRVCISAVYQADSTNWLEGNFCSLINKRKTKLYDVFPSEFVDKSTERVLSSHIYGLRIMRAFKTKLYSNIVIYL